MSSDNESSSSNPKSSNNESISPDNDSPISDNESTSSSIDSARTNSNQPSSGDEVSLDDGILNVFIQRMLMTLSLAILGGISTEFTYWTNFIANIVQLSWASFVQACKLSIEVIRARLGEITGGVSARETLKDVFETISRIFQGALQLTIKLLRGPIQLPTEAFIQDDTLE